MSKREEIVWSSGSDLSIPPDRLTDVLAAAADIVIAIDRAGNVEQILTNSGDQTLGCLDHWVGRDLKSFLTPECYPKFDAVLRAIAADPSARQAVQLNHIDNASWEFPVQYTALSLGADRPILLVGRDLRSVAEVQQQLVKAQVALEKDYEARRDFETRYRLVLSLSRDALVFVDAVSGRIEDANAAAALLLGASTEALVGSMLVQEFEDRRRAEFIDALNTVAGSSSNAPIVALARRNRSTVRIYPTVFRAAGQRSLLCRLESGDHAEPVEGGLGSNLLALYDKGVEAIAFTDPRGIIRSANEAFLNLCDVATAAELKDRSLADYLVRGGVDLKILIEHAGRGGRMRTLATKFETAFGSQRPVEISATFFNDHIDPVIGFVIRETSKAAPSTAPESGAPSGDVTRNVIELVGASPLKDIVAATTDVIEKICIETAVELTRNNRVAAAEMLGLSRQSLYVKLRKYNLADRSAKE